MTDHAFDARIEPGEPVDHPKFDVEYLALEDVHDQVQLSLDLAVFTVSVDFQAQQAEALAKALLEETQNVRNPHQEDDDV